MKVVKLQDYAVRCGGQMFKEPGKGKKGDIK
jgi:hypothetical protein